MDRTQQLYFCKRGIVCGLTDAYAAFDVDCERYEADPQSVKRQNLTDSQQKRQEVKEQTAGLSTIGVKNGTTAGILLSFGGFLLLIIGVMIFQRIFLWPIVFIAAGIAVLVRDQQKKARATDENWRDRSTLDDDL